MKQKNSLDRQMQINVSNKNLFVIEIKLDKKHEEFEVFLSELLEKIDRSIQLLFSMPNYYTSSPVMIVSHEYLYGYDHDNEGMIEDELNKFELVLQSKTNEIAKKYSMDIALSPGTIIVKGDRPSNRAYFFTPEGETRYTDKSKEKSSLFDWNGKKVFISICCNWSSFRYSYSRPIADIYFIPSSGSFFLSTKAHAPYAGMAHEVVNQPGIIFINSEERFPDNSGVYLIKDSAANKTFSLCKEPDHLKYLDKPDAQIFFERIKISAVKIGGLLHIDKGVELTAELNTDPQPNIPSSHEGKKKVVNDGDLVGDWLTATGIEHILHNSIRYNFPDNSFLPDIDGNSRYDIKILRNNRNEESDTPLFCLTPTEFSTNSEDEGAKYLKSVLTDLRNCVNGSWVLYCPLNLGDNHWVYLKISIDDDQKATVRYVDSMSSSAIERSSIKEAIQQLLSETDKNPTISINFTGEQTDSWSCGYRVINEIIQDIPENCLKEGATGIKLLDKNIIKDFYCDVLKNGDPAEEIQNDDLTYLENNDWDSDLEFSPTNISDEVTELGVNEKAINPSSFFQITTKIRDIPPQDARMSSLTNTQYNEVKTLIEALVKEADSCWPYPNKDRKEEKIKALIFLIHSTNQGKKPSCIIKDIEKISNDSYQEAIKGSISTRTVDLFEALVREEKPESLTRNGYV